MNVRDGSGRVNPNNKKMQKNNKSGVKGVYQTKNYWVAQWNDINGKKTKKSFSISKMEKKRLSKWRVSVEKRTM